MNGSSIVSGSQESISILEFYTRHRLVCLDLEEFVSLSLIKQSGGWTELEREGARGRAGEREIEEKR